MADMSQAIRLQLERHAATLRELPDDVLSDYVEIVGAFYMDLRDEAKRREEVAA